MMMLLYSATTLSFFAPSVSLQVEQVVCCFVSFTSLTVFTSHHNKARRIEEEQLRTSLLVVYACMYVWVRVSQWCARGREGEKMVPSMLCCSALCTVCVFFFLIQTGSITKRYTPLPNRDTASFRKEPKPGHGSSPLFSFPSLPILWQMTSQKVIYHCSLLSLSLHMCSNCCMYSDSSSDSNSGLDFRSRRVQVCMWLCRHSGSCPSMPAPQNSGLFCGARPGQKQHAVSSWKHTIDRREGGSPKKFAAAYNRTLLLLLLLLLQIESSLGSYDDGEPANAEGNCCCCCCGYTVYYMHTRSPGLPVAYIEVSK